MRPRKTCLSVGAALLVVTAIVAAAPIIGQKRELPDEVRCLRDLDTVSIDIQEIHFALDDTGMRKRLFTTFQRELERRGIAVDQQVGAPRLVIQYQIARDPQGAPESVALTTMIAVHQRVRLLRLDEQVTVPVASVLTTSMGPRRDLEKLMLRETEAAVRLLARWAELAR